MWKNCGDPHVLQLSAVGDLGLKRLTLILPYKDDAKHQHVYSLGFKLSREA